MKYKQSTVEFNGEVWTRARSTIINNPIDGSKTITIQEEQITETPLGVITKPVGTGLLLENLTDSNKTEEFELLNPETGEVLGTTTYQNVYVTLYSIYMHIAKKRDDLGSYNALETEMMNRMRAEAEARREQERLQRATQTFGDQAQ